MGDKKVWIMNHYATNMFFNKGGRHYWFANNLIKQGYEATIFCANTRHNRQEFIDVKLKKYTTAIANEVPFVFIKTPSYSANDKKRLKNMLSFFLNLFPVTNEYAHVNGKPDIILASSVHPLTLVAGIRIAKKFGVPCICEVRDLWPESLVAYGALERDSLLANILYCGEKWIYRKADAIIMTWEGGKDYIIDQGWQNHIDLSKIYHINNGIIINEFERNSEKYQINDSDLSNTNVKNVIYAGSIRKVNNLGMILDTAKAIQNKGINNIQFLVYGSGDECELLKKRCMDENINNIKFKGNVEKKYIPYILKNAYVNLLHNSSTSLDKYGQSQNKLFEYLAAGRCIVQTYSTGYSILDKYECGISAPVQSVNEIANAIITACSDEEKNNVMGTNARQAAYQFDFENLTAKLVSILGKFS